METSKWRRRKREKIKYLVEKVKLFIIQDWQGNSSVLKEVLKISLSQLKVNIPIKISERSFGIDLEKEVKMLPKEVLHLGDGILQAKPEFLKKILVDAEIEQHYVVEEKPFAR